MLLGSKYRYKIELVTASDIAEFHRIAEECGRKVTIVSGADGKHRLSATSFLGVHLAKMMWNEIYVETDFDCWRDFAKFICS
ncbi:MAG: hypothetical protein IJX14_09560 [Clostridia bacterium]|nr:hypothetical protein [Clostridia bacterium]